MGVEGGMGSGQEQMHRKQGSRNVVEWREGPEVKARRIEFRLQTI